jgi:hypothetical protein
VGPRSDRQGHELSVSSLVVVAGPPGAGKSTYVAERAQPGDVVWDYDTVMAALSGQPLYERPGRLHELVMALRPIVIGQALQLHSRVWVIASAPSVEERDEWRRSGAHVVLLLAGIDELVERTSSRDQADEWALAIGRWWKRYRGSDHDEVVATDERSAP